MNWFGLASRWLVALCVMVGTGLPCLGQDGIVSRSDLRKIGYHQYWEVNLPLDGGESVRDIYYVGDNVYAYTTLGNVIAVEAEAGLARWQLDADSPGRPVYPPTEAVAADGRAVSVVTTTHDVYLVDLRDGDLLSQIHLIEFVNDSAAADSARVYVPTLGGRLISKFWYLPGILGAENAWQVATGDAISAKPIFLQENELCFASHDGGVFACTADRKVLIWSVQTGSAVEGELDADGEAIYAASTDRFVYRINAHSGDVEWRHLMSTPLREGPVVISDMLYQFGDNSGMAGLDAKSGEVLWQEKSFRHVVAEHGAQVLLLNRAGDLQVVDRKSATVNETVGLTRGMMVAQNQANPALFFCMPDGRMLCAMPDDVPFLKASRVRDVASSMRNQPKSVDAAEQKLLESSKDDARGDEYERDPIRSQFDTGASRP